MVIFFQFNRRAAGFLLFFPNKMRSADVLKSNNVCFILNEIYFNMGDEK